MAGDTAPIVVVGGGIGGLAAALALARQGLAVHVLEQAASFGEIGAGIQLGPNVFRMFERLGLTDAIMASAVLPDALVMMDAVTGGEITRVPLGADFRACFTHPYAVIHRADLHAVVLDACRAHKAIRLETGRTVEGYVDDGTGVAVRCADGATVTGRA